MNSFSDIKKLEDENAALRNTVEDMQIKLALKDGLLKECKTELQKAAADIKALSSPNREGVVSIPCVLRAQSGLTKEVNLEFKIKSNL